MEQLDNTIGMLELMLRPAFCVRDGIIAGVNREAQIMMIQPGMPVESLLDTGAEEYWEYTEGCLYLTLQLAGQPLRASVTKNNGFDVFILEQEEDQAELNAMALAARELREPLANVMTLADRLFPGIDADERAQNQVARINRGLFQMLRLVSNMSDAARYSQDTAIPGELREITMILEEIFSRCAALTEQTGITLTFRNLPEAVFTMVSEEKLERAVYNMVSNALKFTPAGGTVDARLVRRGQKLYLTVQDSGCGVDPSLRGSIHARYRRQPGIEDGRFGIGLGMVLIRSAATAHGGTVLMEHPEDRGVRITMTMTIRQDQSGSFRSNILKVDYAGERDHGLIELSECLPASLYAREKIN